MNAYRYSDRVVYFMRLYFYKTRAIYETVYEMGSLENKNIKNKNKRHYSCNEL